MEYQCRSIPINKLPITVKGIVNPLCETCQAKDCSNNLEMRKISIFGVPKKHKVLVRGSEVSIVISCQGYIPDV
jgi:hypothetical protein